MKNLLTIIFFLISISAFSQPKSVLVQVAQPDLSPYLKTIDTTGKWLNPGTAGITYVPKTTTVNGHTLSSNIVVSASDLTTGTLPHAQLPTLLSGDIPNIAESQVTNLTSDLAAKQNVISNLSDTSKYSKKSDTLNQIRTPWWKKWVIFGDSFSATSSRYYGRVDSILNMTGTVTQAVSGAKISDQSAKLDSIIASTPTYFKSFDIASLLIGVNDWTGDIFPLGSVADSAGQVSFAGYLKHIIQTILISNPKIELYVMTPTETNNGTGFHANNSLNWNLDDLAKLEAQICASYGVQLIDLHSLVPFNAQTITTFTDDGLHPNYLGSIVISDIVAHAFTNHNNKGTFTPFSYKNGSYGLGVLLPQATLDIPGSMVNSSTNWNHYRSIANYYTATNVTGTMKIMMPKGWAGNVITATIEGINNGAPSGWKVIISGAMQVAGAWINPSVKIIGAAPFKNVRLSYDSVNNKCVILIGLTSTVWNFPAVEISDLIVNEGVVNGWGTGWAISIVSTETNIATTKTVTPILASYETTSGNTLFGTTTDDGLGKVQVNGKVTYSTDQTMAIADSLVHTDKNYVDRQVGVKNSGIGSLNYIPYWNGDYSLTPSPFYISGGNLFNTAGTFSIQGSNVLADGDFRAKTQFTGMYFDDALQTLRFYANGGNAFKYGTAGYLFYYAHPSFGSTALAVPDKQYVDSVHALSALKTNTVNGKQLSTNPVIGYPDILAGAINNNTTATTQANTDSSTKLATTAFVKQLTITSGGGSGGTTTSTSVVSANGFAGTVATPTTTPAITLSTTITGLLKGNGTAISTATAGTDYLTPTGSAAGLTSFPTLNQNTTGNATTATNSTTQATTDSSIKIATTEFVKKVPIKVSQIIGRFDTSQLPQQVIKTRYPIIYDTAIALSQTYQDSILSEGTYTPTITGVSNFASGTSFVCRYLKRGKTVTIYGKVQVKPTATATITTFSLSLPVSSTFTDSYDAAGTGSGITSGASYLYTISSSSGASTLSVSFVSNQTSFEGDCQFVATYKIL